MRAVKVEIEINEPFTDEILLIGVFLHFLTLLKFMKDARHFAWSTSLNSSYD